MNTTQQFLESQVLKEGPFARQFKRIKKSIFGSYKLNKRELKMLQVIARYEVYITIAQKNKKSYCKNKEQCNSGFNFMIKNLRENKNMLEETFYGKFPDEDLEFIRDTVKALVKAILKDTNKEDEMTVMKQIYAIVLSKDL